jgi:hypothetical protein
MSNPKIYASDIERIYTEWNAALAEKNIDALVALYNDDATLESPLIRHLLKTEHGICRGKDELHKLLTILFKHQPAIRRFHRKNFFTDGVNIIWEYPRQTPDGEQMDFVEVMQLHNSKIQHHRVYWGWRGVKVLEDNEHGV